MTTNVGAHSIKNEAAFGLPGAGEDASFESMKTRVYDEINRAFRPEFLNRLSEEPIIFRHLEKKDLKLVIDLELSKIRNRLRERGYEIELTNDAKEFLIKKGTNLDFGARPLRRALENFVEDPLSEELLHGNFAGKNRIVIDVSRDSDGKMKHLTFEGVVADADADKPLAIGASPAPKTDANDEEE
jgi:ATP-dependent Clp protease ATP-binding subunit ClpC